MNKQEFLSSLRNRILDLPKEDIEKSISFYSEIIDDHIEDGMSEEQAVEALGLLDEIVEQIMSNTPTENVQNNSEVNPKKVKKSNKMSVTNIVLLALGFPLWFPLLIAFGAIILSLLIVLWSVVISFYAVDLSLAVLGLGVIAITFVYIPLLSFTQFLLFIGVAFVAIGLSILLFFGTNILAKYSFILCKKMVLSIINYFTKKGEK